MRSHDSGPQRRWAWLVVLAVGCSGDGLHTTTGTVTYDEKPLETGAIDFDPLDAAARGPNELNFALEAARD